MEERKTAGNTKEFKTASFHAIVAIGFVFGVGYGISTSLLPLYARLLGAPYTLIGLIVSVFFIVRIFSEFPSGIFSHYTSTRTSTVVAVLFNGVSSLVAGLVSQPTLLIISNLLQGVGSALFYVSVATMLGRTTAGARMGRLLSIFFTFNAFGMLVGSVSGSVIANSFGYSITFLSVSLVYLSLPFVMKTATRDSPTARRSNPSKWSESIMPALSSAFHNMPSLIGVAFLAALGNNAVVYFLSPLYARDVLGMTIAASGSIVSFKALGEMTSYLGYARILRRIGHRMLLAASSFVALCGSLVLAQGVDYYMLAAMLWVIGLTSGLIFTDTNLLVMESDPDSVGPKVGILRMFLDVGNSSSPIMFSFAAQSVGLTTTFYLSAGIFLITLIVAVQRPGPSNK